MDNIIGVYHKDCIDGTAAASVLARKFPHAKLVPLSHDFSDADLEPVLGADPSTTLVYTVDCAIGVERLLERGFSVTTIDHHVGVYDELKALAKKESRFTYVFDIEKSGATLTWSYFFPEKEPPLLLKYVEDADLWRWHFGDEARYVTSYLSMLRNDPEEMAKVLEGDLDEIIRKGAVISLYADTIVREQVERSPVFLHIGDHTVPAFNITVYESASGNLLSERLGKAVALFTIKGDRVKLSFRSKKEQRPSALELATLLGGGGHELASGATISLSDFMRTFETNT